MKLSIVTTLYRSAPYIDEFHTRATHAARELVGDEYQIIYVNDGSPDDSLDVAVALTRKDSQTIVIDLSRNFGHHKAMMAGLEYAKGERIFLIDCDLEEDPEWLLSFAETMHREKVDVVYGAQESRKGSRFERMSGAVFYALFNWLSNIDHPKNIVTARLMTRRYVDALVMHSEREMVISCLWVITGFEQHETIVKKGSRDASSYTLRGKVSHVVNAITSFSAVPLKLIFYLGSLIFLVSVCVSVYLVLNALLWARPVDGWTSVMTSIWLLGGMVISFIGVIGIYLSKIFIETKQRPYFIIREVYGDSQQQH